MSSLLCTLAFIYAAYSQYVELESPHTINWIDSGLSLPHPLRNAIVSIYQDYFIVFGGRIYYENNNNNNDKIFIGYTSETQIPTPQPALNPANTQPNPTASPSQDPTSGGTTAYPTPSPTASYGYKGIISWSSNHTLKQNMGMSGEWRLDQISCDSQCYSTNYDGTFFMSTEQLSCSDDMFLYRFYPWHLIHNDEVRFQRYNLTKYFFNETSYNSKQNCKYTQQIQNAHSCVATNMDNFGQTQTVYIVRGDRVFSYNISNNQGYFSNNYFTRQNWYCPDLLYDENGNEYHGNCRYVTGRHFLQKSACLIDRTGKYMWIANTDDNGDGRSGLWRYDIEDNELIDMSNYYYNISTNQANVNGTLMKTLEYKYSCDSCDDKLEKRPYFYDQFEQNNGRMVELSDGFILLTGQGRDFIFLPNLTEATDSWWPQSNTKYIDVVCAGKRHDQIFDWQHQNNLIDMHRWSNTQSVLSFGGNIFTNFTYKTYLSPGSGPDGVDEIKSDLLYKTILSNEIRYYSWFNDFKLVINVTEKILFGDNINFNIFLLPSCDLLQYNSREWTATQHNPIYIELEIEASDASLGIDHYMYIINASEIIDDERGYNYDRTYKVCFICGDEMDLYDQDWNDEEGILSSDNGCVLCSMGLGTGNIAEKQAGIQYQLEFEILQKPNDTTITLESDVRNFTIAECEPGYGTTRGAATIDCNECPFNQFTLRESLDPCIACENIDDGLVCQGGNQTELTYNFWVAVWDYKQYNLKPFYDIQEYDDTDTIQKNDVIVTALCPPKYCCQDVSGCDYLTEYLNKPKAYTYYDGNGHLENGTWIWEYGYTECVYNNGTESCTYKEYDWTDKYREITLYNITYERGYEYRSGSNCYDCGDQYDNADIRANGLLCAFGRDVDVPLCGACLEGWAELLGTTQCGDCRHQGGWGLIVSGSFFLTMFLSWYIIFYDSAPIDYSTTMTKKQLMIQDDLIGFQTLIFKPCLYYFQSLNPIIDTRGITLWLSPVLAFFNFSFDTVGGQSSKICWSEELDACGEILINLLLPLMLMFNLFVPRCCINKKGYGSPPCCCCCKQKKICCCCCTNYQEPYFYSAFFRVLLIVIGVVLTVCFKFVTYVELGGDEDKKKLMFYSADKEAFGGWWFLGFFGIIFVLLSFGYIYWKIKRQQPDDRFSSNSPYRKFVKSFKQKFWYWEFVLFGRRFFVSFFTSVQFVGGDYTNFIFLVVLCIFFGLQIHYKPFAYQRVNKIESLNLLLLISAFAAANFIEVYDEDVFVGWILSICILIPLFIIVIYLLKIVGHRMQWFTYQQDDDKIKVDKMLQRMPKSYRDITLREMGNELEDYNATNSDIKTVKNNDENRHLDDEHQDIAVANVSPKKVEMVSIDNDSVGINEGNNIHMSEVINETEMQPQDNINDDDENILENELDIVMSQDTEPTLMFNPNAQTTKQEDD
eukprot:197961_1